MNLAGGCACGALRYKLTADPLIVHACHCRDCQRLTGSAFVTNIWIERKFVEAGPAVPKSFKLTAGNGKHHEVFFCDAAHTCGANITCRRAIPCWFASERLIIRKPDVHIFTRSKVPWLDLPKDVPAFESFYSMNVVWSVQSKSGSVVMLPSKPDPSASRSVSGA